MNSMQMENDLSNAQRRKQNVYNFYKGLLFNNFPKGGTNRRPLVLKSLKPARQINKILKRSVLRQRTSSLRVTCVRVIP